MTHHSQSLGAFIFTVMLAIELRMGKGGKRGKTGKIPNGKASG
jgi:hypothetical protein